MADLISQQLEKASEDLRVAMAKHAKVNIELQKLKSQFISQTNPVSKEKLKPRLIALNTAEKLAKARLDRAELNFQDILRTEPADVVDLLDHKLKEHYLRLLIRKKITEQINK